MLGAEQHVVQGAQGLGHCPVIAEGAYDLQGGDHRLDRSAVIDPFGSRSHNEPCLVQRARLGHVRGSLPERLHGGAFHDVTVLVDPHTTRS